MKTIFIFLFACSTSICFAQTRSETYVYDGHGNLIRGSHIKLKPGTVVTLQDTTSGNRFVLDSLHINVCAINSKGDTLWTTDPWEDNNLPEYRVKRPVIVQFLFQKNQWTDNKEVIWIVYFNTQFGIINKETGKFYFLGQD